MALHRPSRTTCVAVAATTLATLATSHVPSAGAAPSGAHPVFHHRACPADTFPPDADIECGYIRVPENRAHPNGRTIKVAAAIVHAATAHPKADPIVFLDGGPSFGAISSFALGAYFADDNFTGGRDIVLVDTRGTGMSTPLLNCPEIDQSEIDALYAPPYVNAQSLHIFGDAIKACRDRLTGSGVDLAAYNSTESAADLDALRQALGVARWNLLAISDDGLPGLTYMRLYPHGIRSAIIDSGQSTQMLWGLDNDRGLALELDRVFTGCEASAACNARYPGLRRTFFETVAQLNRHPVTVTLPDFEPHPLSIVVDGASLFADGIYGIFPGDLFDPSGIPDLLEKLWRETHGEIVQVYRDVFGTGPAENSHVNDFFAEGKTLSYACHDSIDFMTPGDLHQAAHDLPAFAQRYLGPDYDIGNSQPVSPAGCRIWDVGQADRVQSKPVRSDIPTLVLAGEYDGGVPPYIVRQVARRLTNAHFYEFPNSAHLQLAFYTNASPCSRRIAKQFLAHPNYTPDSSCIADLPLADFTPTAPGAAANVAERLPTPHGTHGGG